MFSNRGWSVSNYTVGILKHSELTLKIIRLSVHEDVVDKNHTEDTGPEVQVTEQQHKSHILSKTEMKSDYRNYKTANSEYLYE